MSSFVDCFNASTYWIGLAVKSEIAHDLNLRTRHLIFNYMAGANPEASHIVSIPQLA